MLYFHLCVLYIPYAIKNSVGKHMKLYRGEAIFLHSHPPSISKVGQYNSEQSELSLLYVLFADLLHLWQSKECLLYI